MAWEIKSARIGSEKLGSLLKDNWEPFCVTPNPNAPNSGAWVVWLKKKSK